MSNLTEIEVNNSLGRQGKTELLMEGIENKIF